MFDADRPCGTWARGSGRYTREELVAVASATDMPTVGRSMDEICTSLKRAPSGQLPPTAPVRTSAASSVEKCPPGYTYYRGYERRNASGTVTKVSPTCRRKTSVMPGSRREWEREQLDEKRTRQEAASKYFADRGEKPPKCASNEILVGGYLQPSTGRFVAPYCRQDLGRPGRGPPPGEKPMLLKPDRLSPYGYSIIPERLAIFWGLDRAPGKQRAAELRHRALLDAIKSETDELVETEGYRRRDAKSLVALSVSRRLEALARFSRNTRPEQSKLFRSDADWLRKQTFYLAGKN